MRFREIASIAFIAGTCVWLTNCGEITPDRANPFIPTSPPPVQPAPDLQVATPTVSDSCPDAGTTFMLSTTVRNAGDGAAAATTLRYFRSTDAAITTSDTAEGTDVVDAIAAAANADASVTLTAPDAPGTYYYGACVDAVAGESVTTNNCSDAVHVTVPEPPVQTAPDLQVATPTVSDSSPDAGTTFTLSATVRNAGDGAAAATTLRYFRSTDAAITTSDTAEGTDAVDAIAAAANADASVTLTAPDAPGTYYYGACVDAVDGESVTTNNCSDAVHVTVSEPPVKTAPDLQVATPTVSDSRPDAGTTFTLSATVRNAGDGAAAATTLRYFRSQDATITTSDTAEGTDAVDTLAAAASADASVSLTATDAPGTYYYGACVDAVDGESDTTNNCSDAVTVIVSEPPVQTAPDLQVATPTVSDSGPDAGTTFTLSATVRNAGDGAAAVTTLRYFRSTDAAITTSDTAEGTDRVDALAAAASTDASVTLAATDAPGTYYYGACVDAVDGESVTTNNCSDAVHVTVPEPPVQTAPDLQVATPTVSDSSPDAGTTFTLSATVRNAGDGAAAATTLRYFRSTDAAITTSDTAEGTDAVDTLAAAASADASVTLTAPDAPGTYYYGACVDAVDGETVATNNCSDAVHVTVPEPPVQTAPDLQVATPTVSDSSPDAGTTFTLSATVRNAGDGAAAATTLRYFRSTDAAITTSDTAEGTDRVDALAAVASADASVSLTATDAPGTYYYGACVDAVDGETVATNNCSDAVTVIVSEPPVQTAPDLQVATPTVSDSGPDAGTTFTLSATVRNAGDGAAAVTTLRYFRSTDAAITTSDTAEGTDRVDALAAAASTDASVTLAATDAPGTYYYGACVDAVDGESVTTNNCSDAVHVTVPEPPVQTAPDLQVATPTVSRSSPDAGTTFKLSATVRNAGDGAAAATTLRYFRSTDATITTSDTAEGTDRVRRLAGSATSPKAITLVAPLVPGTYYYGACVDAVDGESDTTNNCSDAVHVTVSEPPAEGDHPEIEVHLYGPDSVEEDIGDALLVLAAWTTHNSRAPTESFRVRVWLVSGTADEGVDFGRFNQLIEFKPADFTAHNERFEALKELTITILDDTEAEGDETTGAAMTLESARPFVKLVSPNYPKLHSITILDNDD